MKQKLATVLSVCVTVGFFAQWLFWPVSKGLSAPSVTAKWKVNGAAPVSQTWSNDELSRLKPVVGTKSYSFADFLEKSLGKLTLQQRAAVDLIIVRSRTGESAYVPRTFINQNGLILNFDAKAPAEISPWATAVNTKLPQIRNEKLPLEKFTRQDVIEIELTSYATIYGDFFLKKRSDPKTIRGERLLVQNCLGCHSAMPQKAEWAPAQIISTLIKGLDGHPHTPGFVRLGAEDEKALRSYTSARTLENAPPATTRP